MKYGPERVVQVYDSETGLIGFLVIDNTTLGPGKGGIRLAKGVTDEEVFGLARAMTWKNSMAGLPFGGAKAGIIWDGKTDKNLLIKKFAKALKLLIDSPHKREMFGKELKQNVDENYSKEKYINNLLIIYNSL